MNFMMAEFQKMTPPRRRVGVLEFQLSRMCPESWVAMRKKEWRDGEDQAKRWEEGRRDGGEPP
jgi:hypothetical protein